MEIIYPAPGEVIYNVETADDLYQAFADTEHMIMTVNLMNDIVFTNNINVMSPKATITVNGAYEGSGDLKGRKLTAKDMPINRVFAFYRPENLVLIFTNLIIEHTTPLIFLLFDITSSSDYDNIIFDNVSFYGYCMVATHFGYLTIRNSDIHTNENLTTRYGMSCASIFFIGDVIFDHLAPVCLIFPNEHTASSLVISSGSNVTITSPNIKNALIEVYTKPLDITIQTNAVVSVKTAGSFLLSNNGLRMLTVHNAKCEFIQTAPRSSGTKYSMFGFGGIIDIRDGADFYVETNDPECSCFAFGHNGSPYQSMSIYSPKRLTLCSKQAPVFLRDNTASRLQNTVSVAIQAAQINQWTNFSDVTYTDNLVDLPYVSWEIDKVDDVKINGSFSDTTEAFTFDEPSPPSGSAPITDFKPFSSQVLAMGKLVRAAAIITDSETVIDGTCYPNPRRLKITYFDGTVEQKRFVDNITDGHFTCTLDAPLPAATEILVYTSTDYLKIRDIIFIRYTGRLRIIDGPENVVFSFQRIISSPPRLYGREPAEMLIKVRDSRVRSTPWTLSVRLDGDLKTALGNTLPDAVVFCDSDGTIVPVPVTEGSYLEIFKGPQNMNPDVPKETSILWDEDRGMLLLPDNTPIVVNREYSSPIHWLVEPAE